MSNDFLNFRKVSEEFSEFSGFFSRDQEVEVMEGFFGTTVRASNGGAIDLRVFTKSFESSLCERCHLTETKAVGEFCASFDGTQDFFHSFGPEACKISYF